MSIQVDGIISGIDTSSLISEMVGVYSAPKTLLEQDINDYNTLQSALTDLSSRLSDLSSSLTDLQDVTKFRQFAVNYPETDAFIADTSGEAVAGVYAVEVTALAKSELEVSEGFADTTSTGVIAEGIMSITYGGVTTDITVDATNSSLSELAAAIDGVDGLTAYVMDTGDAVAPYRLVIQGEDTGASNSITIDTSGLTGAGTAPTFTEQVAASNAELSINGIDISAESNTVSSAIPGLSLTLTGLTSEPIDVAVSLDADGMQEKVQDFITAYNDVIEFVNNNSVAADEDAGTGAGIFNGDSSVRRIVQSLRERVSSIFTTGGSLQSLGMIGISTTSDGTLDFDGDAFKDALEEDRSSVELLFTSDSGFGKSIVDAVDVFIDPLDGSIKQRNDTIDDTIASLEDQIARWEVRIASYEERLRRGFTAFESAAGVLQGTASFIASYFSSSSS